MARPRKPTRSVTLKQDPLVDRLRPDPSQPLPDVVVLFGYLGKSSEREHWRLYLTTQLNEYVEIAEGDILETESVATEKNLMGGTRLWIRRDAPLQHVRVNSRQVEAEFLQGDITGTQLIAQRGTNLVGAQPGPFLQEGDTIVRTCLGQGAYHVLTKVDLSCPTQTGCTQQPECPRPKPPLPPLPPLPPHVPTEPWAMCTRNVPNVGHVTHERHPIWCP